MSTKEYIPENTETTLYLRSENYYSLSDVIDNARAHFGDDIQLSELQMDAEHFHARNRSYDLYDLSDYDNYIVITKL